MQVKYNKTGKDVEAANGYAKSQGEPEVRKIVGTSRFKHMLPYAAVCGRMLTHADVCWQVRRKIVGIIMQLKEEAGRAHGSRHPLLELLPPSS